MGSVHILGTTTPNNRPTFVEPGIHPTFAVVGAGYTKLFAQDDTKCHVHFHRVEGLPSLQWYGVGKTHVLARSPGAQELQLFLRPPFYERFVSWMLACLIA